MQFALANPADNAEPPVSSDCVSAEQPDRVPIIEVAFKNGMWWSIPWEVSQALYEKHLQGEMQATHGIGVNIALGRGSTTTKTRPSTGLS